MLPRDIKSVCGTFPKPLVIRPIFGFGVSIAVPSTNPCVRPARTPGDLGSVDAAFVPVLSGRVVFFEGLSIDIVDAYSVYNSSLEPLMVFLCRAGKVYSYRNFIQGMFLTSCSFATRTYVRNSETVMHR